jgi:hypothetical protein
LEVAAVRSVAEAVDMVLGPRDRRSSHNVVENEDES